MSWKPSTRHEVGEPTLQDDGWGRTVNKCRHRRTSWVSADDYCNDRSSHRGHKLLVCDNCGAVLDEK